MSPKDMAINGDSAVAFAWKQIDPDVCAAYPITPQTIIVERFSDYVADGEVNTNFVCVESEHSALTLCTASSSAVGSSPSRRASCPTCSGGPPGSCARRSGPGTTARSSTATTSCS